MNRGVIKRFATSKPFAAFVMGFAMYILVMLPELINSSGILALGGDYSEQSIAFTFHIQDILLSGNFGWDWSSGLGNDFMGSYAYYGIFSPFTALYLIVPRDALIYAIPIVSAVKYGTGSALACLYIRRFVKNEHYAVIGGILYMFSSFMGYNLVFHFADICALFPLLLISLETLVTEKRRGFFAISVAIAAMTNYYFFFGQVVFIVIYYFVRCTDKRFGFSMRHFLSVLLEAVIGVLLAAFVLLPVLFSLAASSKATSVISLSSMLWYENIFYYLHIIQSFFMLPDQFYFCSLFPAEAYEYPRGLLGASVAGYLPLFSLAGVISYIAARKKTWEKRLLIICAVMLFIPVLNQAFSAFNSNLYTRWYYMPLLISAMVSVKALEEKVSFKSGIISCGVALGLMVLYQIFADTDAIMREYGGYSYVSLLQNIIHFAITAICLAVLIVVVRSKRDKDFIPKLYIFTIASSYMVFGFMAYYANSLVIERERLIAEFNIGGDTSEFLQEDERVSTNDASKNYNLIWGCESVTSFNSTHDSGFESFMIASGLQNDNGFFGQIGPKCKEISDLVSVKYYLKPNDGEVDDMQMKYIGDWGVYCVYENLWYIPLGFTFDTQMSQDAFLSVEDISTRQRLYMRSLITENTDVFSDILPVDNSCGAISDEEYRELVKERQSETAYYLEKDSSGLVSRINLEKENVVFYSVSYNENWKAYVDGEETTVYTVDNGLIGIRVPSGDHEVALCYKTKGATEGVVISLAGVAALAFYIIIARKLRHKKTAEKSE